jgi:hypothetical protein
MITVACVLKQGGKVGYNADWVAKLRNSVTRNLSQPHQFVCLSDCEVECERIPLINSGPGFWSKLELFRPGLFDTPVLYIDLDTVICGSLDQVVDRIQNQQFVMLHETDKNVVSSAVMWWRGDHSSLYAQWSAESQDTWAAQYSKMPRYGDQAFIEDRVKHTLLQDHIPQDWVAWSSQKQSSPNARLLIFRKVSQKPSTMLDHALVQAHWH